MFHVDSRRNDDHYHNNFAVPLLIFFQERLVSLQALENAFCVIKTVDGKNYLVITQRFFEFFFVLLHFLRAYGIVVFFKINAHGKSIGFNHMVINDYFPHIMLMPQYAVNAP